MSVAVQNNPESVNQRLRSAPSRTISYIRFVNKTERRVDVIWINYEGLRVKYKTLEPGDFFDANTFVNHPWIFRDTKTREKLVAVSPPKGSQSIYNPAPWYEPHLDDIRSGRLQPNQLNQVVERVVAFIRCPLLSLRDCALQAVRNSLKTPEDAHKLEIPSVLRRDIAEWTEDEI